MLRRGLFANSIAGPALQAAGKSPSATSSTSKSSSASGRRVDRTKKAEVNEEEQLLMKFLNPQQPRGRSPLSAVELQKRKTIADIWSLYVLKRKNEVRVRERLMQSSRDAAIKALREEWPTLAAKALANEASSLAPFNLPFPTETPPIPNFDRRKRER